MSYLLDALRKADAERARGSLPTLQAQPSPRPASEAGTRARSHLGWGLLIGVLLLAAGAMVWQMVGRPAVPPTASPAPGAVAAPTALPSTPATAAVPASSAAATVAAAAVPAEPLPRIVLPEVPPPAPPPARPVPGVVPSAASASGPASAAVARVLRIEDLSDAVRRQLPALKFSGSVYSEQPSSRFVMINGQLLREGDTVAPGLVLERIQPRSVVLRQRDQRFEVSL